MPVKIDFNLIEAKLQDSSRFWRLAGGEGWLVPTLLLPTAGVGSKQVDDGGADREVSWLPCPFDLLPQSPVQDH